MVNLLPVLPGQLNIQNQEPGAGGIESNRDSASVKGSSSPFAGILHDQSASASLRIFHPLTKSFGQQQHLAEFERPLYHSELAGDADPQLSLVTVLDGTFNLYEEKQILPPFHLKGEDGEGVDGDKEIPQEVFAPLPERFFPEIQVLSGGTPQAVFAGALYGENLHLPPVFRPFSQSLFPGRISVPGSPAETKMPDAGLTPSVAYPYSPLTGIDIKRQTSVAGSLEREHSEVSAVDSRWNAATSLERTTKPLHELETLLPKIPPTLAKDSRENLRQAGHQPFQAPSPIQDSPAGIAEVLALNQYRLKIPNGFFSPFSAVSEQGKASSIVLASDFLKDANFSLTGEHAKNFSEGTGKMMGVEQQGGQSLNPGLGGSPHSHQGFQQGSPLLQTGTGIRMAEDRMTEFPTPALQRLQLDVQLSETNRIYIDVGVQHRQVYAGLVLDQASLKILAVQNVPQLENQLAQADMELQEFSAEVRDHHREQEQGTDPHLSGMTSRQREFPGHSHTREHPSPIVRRIEESGLHFVA